MFWAGLAVSSVIGVAYLALAATIARNVLLVGAQWRSNPLAVATAGIFFSCGIGHGIHTVHLLEHGRQVEALYDPHVVLWDLTTAAVAVWYWSIRRLLSALHGSGDLFQDVTAQERARLAGVLHELFDGVEVLPAGAVGDEDLPAALAAADRGRLLALVAAVAADGRTGSVELTTTTGAVLEVRASRWTDEVVLAWRDVTELREAQRARAEVEAQLAAAFDAAPVAMAVLAQGRVERGNRALGRLLGVQGQAEGTPFDALFEPDGRRAAAERLRAVHEGRPSTPWEGRLVQPDGEGRWAEVSLAAVHGHAGSGPRPATQVVAHLVDVEERKAYEARLRHIADHDPLTGLVNRRRFDEELRRQCARSTRGRERRGALLMLDLDHFKEVNDTLGHAVGDQLIVGVSQVLRRHVRERDVVARLGGDEFAVLCTDADREEAVALAERLGEAVRLHTGGLADSTGVIGRVTCSVGLAPIGVQDTPESLLVAADLALYDAKEAGRDRCAVHRDDHHGQPRTQAVSLEGV